MRRLRLLAAATVLAAAACAGVTAATGPSASGADVVPAAPGDLRGSLSDTSAPARDGMVTWNTTWRVAWPAVAGAATYEVYAVGPEGEASAPMRILSEPVMSLSVAAGTTTPAARQAQRDGQIAYRATQLGIRVVAVSAEGRKGPSSPALPVGQLAAG